jgi:Ca-activated chloride channel family protein
VGELVLADVESLVFETPAYLWLNTVPAVLVALWAWRAMRRQLDLRRLREARVSPVRQRWSRLGDLPFWLCLVLACAALVLALARPRGVAPRLGRTGLDLVVLQDGSSSMHVRDVPAGTRWARSMQFLRRLGDALRWEDDRMALTVFARIATPQIRLTRDPNTVFFFLDHLGERSPFALEDETTWDTNVEEGIEWGLRVLRKDREILGASPNAPAFILVSDGETWSGEVARAIDEIHDAGVPLFVVGVGTLAGGRMPKLPFPDDGDPPPLVSRLDRRGLQRLAAEGRGQYYELDRDVDREIANAIINASRRPAPLAIEDAETTDLHWPLVAASCALVGLGTLFTRRRPVLLLQLAGALVALIVSLRILLP